MTYSSCGIDPPSKLGTERTGQDTNHVDGQVVSVVSGGRGANARVNLANTCEDTVLRARTPKELYKGEMTNHQRVERRQSISGDAEEDVLDLRRLRLDGVAVQEERELGRKGDADGNEGRDVQTVLLLVVGVRCQRPDRLDDKDLEDQALSEQSLDLEDPAITGQRNAQG